MKKRIFNTAVAIVTAMSLSVCAFAEAGPGASGEGPGASGDQEPTITLPGFEALPGASISVLGADVVEGEEVELTSDEGISVRGDASLFAPATHVYLGASLRTNASDDSVMESVDAHKADINLTSLGLEELGDIILHTALRVKLYNQDLEAIQPSGALTVSVPTDGKSNIVAYVGENGEFEWIELNQVGSIMSFKTAHFSDYYYLEVTEGKKPGPATPSFPSNGNTSSSGGSTSTDTTAASEDNATQAPDSTEATEANTTKAPGSNDQPNNDITNNGGDTTNTTAIEDGNSNNNVGNDGAGNGADKNQATGVVLAVIPAAIAAAAVVISKKRK